MWRDDNNVVQSGRVMLLSIIFLKIENNFCIALQCFDAVDWATGRHHPACKKRVLVSWR